MGWCSACCGTVSGGGDPGPSEDSVLPAFSAEAGALVGALRGLTAQEWALPTGCPPWTVAELAAHVEIAVGRVLAMLDDAPSGRSAPSEGTGLVDAAGYYRADARFSVVSNAERIRVAQVRAAELGGGVEVARALEATCAAVAACCAREPVDRTVVTRHSDPMLLRDFLLTRVVELVVHGLDLALAVDRQPWSSAGATDLVLRLLTGDESGARRVLLALEAGPVTVLLKATGRTPLTERERERLDALGMVWLALG